METNYKEKYEYQKARADSHWEALNYAWKDIYDLQSKISKLSDEKTQLNKEIYELKAKVSDLELEQSFEKDHKEKSRDLYELLTRIRITMELVQDAINGGCKFEMADSYDMQLYNRIREIEAFLSGSE